MRVNVYAEEMTDKVELIEKTTKDGTFVGVRFWLELPATVPVAGSTTGEEQHVRGPFMHHPGDNDSAAVTFWGKAQLKVALKKAIELLGLRVLDEHAVKNLETIASNLKATRDDDCVPGEVRGYGSAILRTLG